MDLETQNKIKMKTGIPLTRKRTRDGIVKRICIRVKKISRAKATKTLRDVGIAAYRARREESFRILNLFYCKC
mgnify:CR=1 FL=1